MASCTSTNISASEKPWDCSEHAYLNSVLSRSPGLMDSGSSKPPVRVTEVVGAMDFRNSMTRSSAHARS